MNITFLETEHDSADYKAACVLRDELLRRPLGLNLFDEDLDSEYNYIHVVGKDESGKIIAYLQFMPITEDTLKMQQVVVAEHVQGQGIGRDLVCFSERTALGAGFTHVTLHARESVIEFYEDLGYLREMESFIEVTIPHFKARKTLR